MLIVLEGDSMVNGADLMGRSGLAW